MKSAIIGWNLANFVTIMLMLGIIWVLTSLISHFMVRKGKQAASGFASTSPAAPGATLGGNVSLSLVA